MELDRIKRGRAMNSSHKELLDRRFERPTAYRYTYSEDIGLEAPMCLGRILDELAHIVRDRKPAHASAPQRLQTQIVLGR